MSDPLDALWFLCEQELGTQERMSAAVDKAKEGGTDLGGGQVKVSGRAGSEIVGPRVRKPQPRPNLSGGAKLADSGDYLVVGKPQDKVGKVDTSDPQALLRTATDRARKDGSSYPDAVQQTTGSPPPIDTPQAKATIATGMSTPSQANDKPGRDNLQQGRTDDSGAVSVSARIHDMEGKDEVSQQNLQEPGRSETDSELQDGEKIKASGSQPAGEDEPSTAGQAVAQKSSDPNKSLSAMAPEFAQKPGFTDTLPSSNDDYLKRIQDSGHQIDGVDFVDLKSELGDLLPQGIPGKYLDVLSRALVTKTLKGKTDSWSHYGEGLKGGAGKVYSQMGELLTLIMSNTQPENRDQVADLIRSQIQKANAAGLKTGEQTVTEDWLDASLANAEAIDTYLKLEGDGATIVGGSWDQPDELASLGIGGEGGEEKGFSTDIVIRDSNGKNHQISLKKDGNVNFLNSGAGHFTKFILSAAAEDENHEFHDLAKGYMSDIERTNEIFSEIGLEEYDENKLPTLPSKKDLQSKYGLTKEQADKYTNEVKELNSRMGEARKNKDIVPRAYNQQYFADDQNKLLDTNYSKSLSNIKNLDIDNMNMTQDDLFAEAYKEGNFSDEIYDKFFDEDGNMRKTPKAAGKKVDMEEYNRAKQLRIQAGKDAKSGEISSDIKKLMKDNNIDDAGRFFDMLMSNDIMNEKGNPIDGRLRRKLMHNAILATNNEISAEHRKASKELEQNFASSAIEAISNDPTMKAGTLNSLRKNFPLKDVANGKESMVIGNATFSKKVLEEMFGTTDFNQIKDKMTIQTGPDGVPYLGYQVEIDADNDGEAESIIPIANIKLREKGVGYSNALGFDMTLRGDFYKRLQEANAKLGTNLTAEDILALFFGKKQLFVEAIRHLIPTTDEEMQQLTETIDFDYNDDVDFLRKYGRA